MDKVITICEYRFELTGINVEVIDTSLGEIVGGISTVGEFTEKLCREWLEEFYEL